MLLWLGGIRPLLSSCVESLVLCLIWNKKQQVRIKMNQETIFD